MRMKPRQSLPGSIFLVSLLVFLASCADEESQVGKAPRLTILETAIPGMYFEIPEGALPSGLDPADIRIEPTKPPQDLAESSVDADVRAWKLTPDGTLFEKPIRLVVPFTDAFPSFLHLYNGERSQVSEVMYTITPQGHTASVPLEHFSDLIVYVPDTWQQALDFSAAVPDTEVGELVDARLTVGMADYFVSQDNESEELGAQIQYYVVPGSKTACGPEPDQRCSVFSEDENLEPKDIEAFRKAANLQPEILPFEDQFTLRFGGFRCIDVGPAFIKFEVRIGWEGIKRRESDDIDPDPWPKDIWAVVHVPLNCVERTAVVLVEVDQSVSVDAYALRASNREEFNESREDEFYWSAWDGRNPDMQSTGTGSVTTESEVSIPVGLESLARFSTNTRFNGPILSVNGQIGLDLRGMADIDRRKWGVLGSAGADLSLSVTIRETSVVKITNCVLFDQTTFRQFADYRYSDETCTFKVDGASTLELPSVGELPGISLPPESGSPGGTLVMFILDVYRSNEEPLREMFRISVRPARHLTTFFPDDDIRVLLR